MSGARPLVVCLGHRFRQLDVERAILEEVADVIDGNTLAYGELNAILGRAAGVLLGSQVGLDREALRRMRACRVVVRYGIGVDNVDVVEAARQGILVGHVPGFCVEEVATHTLALLLCAHRRIHSLDDGMRRGGWGGMELQGIRRLSGLTLGIVGLGQIGQAVAVRAGTLGMKVLAFDPYAPEEVFKWAGAGRADFCALLERADFVSLHCPLTSQTRGLIDRAALRRMKPTAWLMNTSRGAVVSERDLVEALREGWIGGAALDVYEQEPLPPEHPFRSLPNVILTPHAAWYSEEAEWELRRKAAEEVRAVLEGRSLRHPVQPVTAGS